MTNLMYTVSYTPVLDTGYGAEEKGINFLCVDNKIHIRLRDYDKPMVISGFIDKLTYLITYLVNSSCANSSGKNPDDFIKSFYENDSDVEKIINVIANSLHEPRFAGIKITKAYRKKDKTVGLPTYYGLLADGAVPVVDGYKLGDLTHFLAAINLSLYSFLFNDAYSIIIQESDLRESLYSKYSRKEERKDKVDTLEYVRLW